MHASCIAAGHISILVCFRYGSLVVVAKSLHFNFCNSVALLQLAAFNFSLSIKLVCFYFSGGNIRSACAIKRDI